MIKVTSCLVAAQTYRQQGANDFWGGPISKDPNTSASQVLLMLVVLEFDRFWSVLSVKTSRTLLPMELTTPDIESWPGNGNVANG
jgi:hypothetical protein